MGSVQNYSWIQSFSLIALRLFIGWHLLYEGIVKLWSPNWSSAGYLNDSAGFFKEYFFWLAGNESVLKIADILNIWGLILIGLSLIVGLLTRWALVGGIVLLGFYYLSHPPLLETSYALPSEGSYLFVNKNLIELTAMLVLLVFPTSRILGLDRLLFGNKSL